MARSLANLRVLPISPEQAVLRQLEAAREQLDDARARLEAARQRVRELEGAVDNLEDLALEVMRKRRVAEM